MWVFCCGMRRSGSTLQFQLTARIAEEEGIGKRIEWVRPEDFPIVRERYKEYAGLKIFKSHIYTPEIGMEFEKQNAMGVYIYRDIRDAFLSQKSKDKVTFSAMWMQNFLESAMKNYYEWTQVPGVLVSKYEDVMTDLPREVRRIAAHLGVNYDEAKCRRVAQEYSLERQKERISKSSVDNFQQHQKATFDAKELLHVDHIYSGESDRWRREMSPWQATLIERKAGKWLLQNGYALNRANLSSTDRVRVWMMYLAAKIVKVVYYRGNTR